MSTSGKSNKPEQVIHHTFWFYGRVKSTNLLRRILCEECNTSYPSSATLRKDHPDDKFLLVKNIKHVGRERR
jgi:hypothetical protein